MPTDREILNAARHLIKTHGRDAARFAGVNSDHLEDKRDTIGAAHWRSIAQAVKEIEAGTTDDRSAPHDARH